ncbi:TRAP dicarboxylate transporter, DctQ subunit, unknown substrate 6 [uncultured Gammaproteobacteria bacterium]|nr:TRAP dicarboxylate transporter, DctQ subunit, unknown substrate 6 [Bathymodiolus brooksi thiotrophic gill symbiont]CAC9572279.1 TRAP dicarboxylate transporter, DctQ subunit, unknown substrate 6 [uncultured Gammaproteobacteria bacterium]CAC9574438.1 TRAP dicarboxylate transporter, DctQ subunit, unknown substrate 6 [uncultured Gammaproteobacteria bacterium]CAC9578809.1 TRAP dicarboxylate transporter, DctQ subunit, unknown substrate 6 [uncultured Gammaproteobacteria bacterium]CAC9957524.1 TRAP 
MSHYTRWLERLIVGLLLLTIFNVFLDVLLRYAFNNSSIALQEMEWHLFSAMFLLGISYTLQKDAHVRVDIFYTKFSPQKQALINLIGFALCILPISLLVAYYGIDFAYSAYLINEQSGDPGGLTHRFIIKSIIPISFILIIISGILFAKNNYEVLKQ